MKRSWVHRPAQGPGDPAVVGGKGAQLGRLREAGAPVPLYVVLTAEAFRDHPSGRPGPELLKVLQHDLVNEGLGEGRVAVRSSAIGEDGAGLSFAGQFETVLGVDARDALALGRAIARVWASARGERALAYAGGLRLDMPVVVQAMVPAIAAGVAFSADPVSGEREVAVISAVPGLGEALVSGESDADTWTVEWLDGRLHERSRRIATKPRALRSDPEGRPVWEDLGPVWSQSPSLGADDVISVAEWARRLEKAWAAPVDLEFAFEELDGQRQLRLLQARPITALKRFETQQIWDNSNIVESYSGVTLPLTFSFARAVYEEAYRQFGLIMGVEPQLLERHQANLANRLGSIRGRVYYNLVHWFQSLSVLPGYHLNRGFMEKMMGVREAMPALPPLEPSESRWREWRKLGAMLFSIFREHWALDRSVKAFHARVQAELGPYEDSALDALSEAELLALFRRLELQLLKHWRAPLVNDFFAMVYFGAMTALLKKWAPGLPESLANDLLCGEGGIISTEPVRQLQALARSCAKEPLWMAHVQGGAPARERWLGLQADPAAAALKRALDAQVRRFGDRCAGELKLETLSYRQEPWRLLDILAAYVAQGTPDPAEALAREQGLRREASERIRGAMPPLRRAVFAWLLARCRARVRDRENLRFERTRTFGLVRRLFLALGGQMQKAGILADARDVFYLHRDEVFGAVEGSGVTRGLKALVELRRAEYDAYELEAAPPERFQTLAFPNEQVPFAAAATATAGDLQGLGCCPGIVRAPVRLVRDPGDPGILTGRILVAERTDPGWTLLFPQASGILVERGSLLSHSAIVAREMGLPCVVMLPGLMAGLKDGEVVEMDGAKGTVRRIEGPP